MWSRGLKYVYASKYDLIVLTVIAWSALIAPKMEAADPLAFFYEFKPLAHSGGKWALNSESVIGSEDGQHAAGFAIEHYHEKGWMIVMDDGAVGGELTLVPMLAYGPTNELLRVYGRVGAWKMDYEPIGTRMRVRRAMSDPVFSADGKHVAFVGEEGFGQCMVYDGKVSGELRQIDGRSVRVLEDGSGVVYCGSESSNWRLVVNDRVDREFVAVRDSVVVSQEGGRLAYLGVRDGLWYVISDSAKGDQRLVSKGYLMARSGIVMAKDGSKTAVWVQNRSGMWGLCVNDQVEEGYTSFSPGDIVVSDDGAKVAATRKRADGQWEVIVNGQVLMVCDEVGAGSLQFTENGRLVVGVMWHGLWYVCVDGELGEAATALRNDVFEVVGDGDAFVYAARDLQGQWHVVMMALNDAGGRVDWRSRGFDGIEGYSVVVSEDGKKVGYVAEFDGMRCLMVGDEILAMRKWMGLPRLSKDGQRIAVLASKGERFEMLVDGKVVGEPFVGFLGQGRPTWDGQGKVSVVVERERHRFASLQVMAGGEGTDVGLGGK